MFWCICKDLLFYCAESTSLNVNLKLNYYPFIFIYYRMERQRREEELKNRSSKKANDAEHAILNRVVCSFQCLLEIWNRNFNKYVSFISVLFC
jgi:hypothetical protein